jgi:hypothetical protein
LRDTTNRFVIKLLSSTQEVGLRRLRSYAASIGGGALIYSDYNKIIYDLERAELPRSHHIVVYDDSLPLSDTQMTRLKTHARIFHLSEPQSVAMLSPVEDEGCWSQESYLQCNIKTMIDSPVVRVCMAQLCHPTAPLYLQNLLRWGHAYLDWTPACGVDISRSGLDFTRKFNLAGEWRRLMEMFCHFVTTRCQALELPVESVRFASDGVLLAAVAKSGVLPKFHPRNLIDELRVHSFPIVAVNRQQSGEFEFAAFYTPFHPLSNGSDTVVLSFAKNPEDVQEEDLEKVS